MVRRLSVLLVVLVACTSTEAGDSTSIPGANDPDSTTIAAPTTTLPPPPVFHMHTDVGLGLEVFERGLIPTERPAVDTLFWTAPLYEMDLVLKPDLTGVAGSQSVRLVNNEGVALSEIVFRLFPNISEGSAEVSNVEVDGSAVEVSYDLEDSVMRVPLPSPLAPTEETVITMDIDVSVPIDEGGKYGTFLLKDDILAAAHFFPILAVYDDEGWNLEIPPDHGDSVFSDAGFFLVRLVAPIGLPVVTSGQLVAKADLNGVSDERFYAGGPMRDFYLAASHRFEVIQVEVGETTINSYAPAEFAPQAHDMMRFADSALVLLGEALGDYPYSELDIVSTRTSALGIEYPGAIAMAMGHYDPAEEFSEATVVSTLVHEIAHQWFYGTIGNDQLDEPWLDEAFAQYATWFYFAETQGEGGEEGFRAHLESRWGRVDFADIPIGLPAAGYEPLEYGAIVYGRAPLEIDELAQIMGEDVFRRFIADYAERFKYGIARTEDLQELAESFCDCDLDGQFEAVVYPR